MLKRILAALLCVILLASVLPVSALAETEPQVEQPAGPTANELEAQRIRNEIRRMYYRVLYASGMDSLHGFCGMMSSYQLWLLGINPYPIVYDGNNQYDAYKDEDMTLGGHSVKAYSASQYTLEEALNTISNHGTKNVYNILVGFQWTNTAAGALYGHALVINAIIDGVVFFSEGYASEFNLTPGMPCEATIQEFARSYNAWTRFEGLIVFGRKDFTDFCTEYPAHLFVEATAPMHSLHVPSTASGESVRQILPGERLEVTALYENVDGEFFYQVEDCGAVSYIPSDSTRLLQFNAEDITIEAPGLPDSLALHQDFYMTGRVFSEDNLLTGVRMVVTDPLGQPVLNRNVKKSGKDITLGTWWINDPMHFDSLEKGVYTYSIYANVTNYYVDDSGLNSRYTKVLLASGRFTVDMDEPVDGQAVSLQQYALANGWEYSDGVWRYYENGEARTGWFCYKGIDYYLLEDGAAATGWYTVNGKPRYFTSTGAMRTGWLTTREGTYYMLFNGQAATGERTIGKVTYTFDDTGLLLSTQTEE